VVFVKLSVRDNLIAAQEFKALVSRSRPSPTGGRACGQDDRALSPAACRAPAAGSRRAATKLIDIAMALVPAPRLVLLDEPCAGVNPSLVDQLRSAGRTQQVAGWQLRGHRAQLDFIMALPARHLHGQGRCSKGRRRRQANPQVLEAYLGN
jgi:branched-chain amino acid transport system ATP-binding protein